MGLSTQVRLIGLSLHLCLHHRLPRPRWSREGVPLARIASPTFPQELCVVNQGMEPLLIHGVSLGNIDDEAVGQPPLLASPRYGARPAPGPLE